MESIILSDEIDLIQDEQVFQLCSICGRLIRKWLMLEWEEKNNHIPFCNGHNNNEEK